MKEKVILFVEMYSKISYTLEKYLCSEKHGTRLAFQIAKVAWVNLGFSENSI